MMEHTRGRLALVVVGILAAGGAVAATVVGSSSPASYAATVAERLPAEMLAVAFAPRLDQVAPLIDAALPGYELTKGTLGSDPEAPVALGVLFVSAPAADGPPFEVVALTYGLREPLASDGQLGEGVTAERVGDATVFARHGYRFAMVAWPDRVVLLDGDRDPFSNDRRPTPAAFGDAEVHAAGDEQAVLAAAQRIAAGDPEAALARVPSFGAALEGVSDASLIAFGQAEPLRRTLTTDVGRSIVDRGEVPVVSALLGQVDAALVAVRQAETTLEVEGVVVGAAGGQLLGETRRELPSAQLSRLPSSAYHGLSVSVDVTRIVDAFERMIWLSRDGRRDWEEGQRALQRFLGVDLRRDFVDQLTGDFGYILDGAPMMRADLVDAIGFVGVRQPEAVSRSVWQASRGLASTFGRFVETRSERVGDTEVTDIRAAGGQGVSVAVFGGALWVATRPGALRSIILAEPGGSSAAPFDACTNERAAVAGFLDVTPLRSYAEYVVTSREELFGLVRPLLDSTDVKRVCWGVSFVSQGAVADAAGE